MIQTIIILSLIVVLLGYILYKQLFKNRILKAQVEQCEHAIKAFEDVECKIGELERKYEKAKAELEATSDPAVISNILNGLQNRIHSS